MNYAYAILILALCVGLFTVFLVRVADLTSLEAEEADDSYWD
jgi:hypothetical protein